MPQEELVQKLCQRIQILVNEVETLTAMIENNVAEQQDVVQKYQMLYESYKQKESELIDTQNKLNMAFRNNIKDHLVQIHEDRQHITMLLSEQRNDMPGSQNQALYQLCQQKTLETQDLRTKMQQIEQQNALLHSENIRLRTYIQHEKMFRQLEQFNGNYQHNQQQENYSLNFDQQYEQKHLQEYLDARTEA